MEFIARHATETDLPGLLEIYNDAILNTTAVYDYAPHTLEMRQKWLEEKSRLGLPVMVIEQQGRIAGFASYGPFRAWAAYQYTVEHSIYVHPDFRRQGIANALLHALISYSRQKDIHTMVAGIDAENSVSIALHHKFGFENAGCIKQVGYKFGKWLDLVFLQLILDNDFHPGTEKRSTQQV
jgi:L-amino acid N-acyltransferase YncA